MLKYICKHDFPWWISQATGLSLLAYYFYVIQDFEFSLYWALMYPVIGLFIGFTLTSKAITGKWPFLKNYYCNKFVGQEKSQNVDEDYVVSKTNHLLKLSKKKSVWFLLLAEDGLVFVPVLLIGINPYTAVLSGVLFIFIHLNNYSYLECIGKFFIAYFVCMILLPYGILTVIVGHYINDIFALLSLRAIQSKYMPDNTLSEDSVNQDIR